MCNNVNTTRMSKILKRYVLFIFFANKTITTPKHYEASFVL